MTTETMQKKNRGASAIIVKLLGMLLILSVAVIVQRTWNVVSWFSMENISVWLDKAGF